jgi:protein O-mannosyl-transferase
VTSIAASARARTGLIVLCALIAYANAPRGAFHFDDAHAVQENPSIRSLANLGRFFTDAGAFSVLPQNQGYRPLLLVSYALTARFTGVDARAFIAVSLVVHILCALLVAATVRLTLRHIGRPENADPIAWVSGLIFATHPLFSECVNYVSARSESLSGLFTIAALYGYLRARERWVWLPIAVVALAAALLTKPVATIFPLFLIVFEAAAAERHSLRRIAPRFATMTALVIALGLLGARMTPAFAIRSASSFTRAQYFRSELPAVWHYVRLFVFPAGQNADAAYPLAESFTEPRVFVAAVALVGVIAFAVWGLIRRRYTGVAVAIAWFILCIFPSSSVFPLAEIVNEHRPYLAAASLCALAAAALIEGLPRGLRLSGAPAQEATFTVGVILIALFSGLTFARNRVWRNEETLWADVLAKSPHSTRAQMNYGLALMSSGRLAESEPYLREAVRLAPYYPYAHVNLGNMLLAQGKTADALMHLDQAIQYDPNLFWGHYFRGLAAERLGEPPAKRAEHFENTVRVSPNYPDGWYHLSLAADVMRDPERALRAARRAVALRGNYEDRFMLAYLLIKGGDLREAKMILLKLQREKAADTRIQHNLELIKKREAGK